MLKRLRRRVIAARTAAKAWRRSRRVRRMKGVPEFLQVARQSFLELQAAWDRADWRALQQLVQWTLAHEDAVLCIRPRAGETPPEVPMHERIVITGQELALPVLLHACDLVVTLTSTVGLEGHLAGCRLVQVTGSVFDEAMPLLRYGIADDAVPLGALTTALDRWTTAPRHTAQNLTPATECVLSEISAFL